MSAQPIKNAAEHLESLKDGRTVYIGGQLAGDVTEHPAFRNSVRTAANLYDYQADPANAEAMTFESPTNGRRVNRAWQMPESYEELVVRRNALIVIGNVAGPLDRAALDAVERYRLGDDPVLAEHAAWARQRLEARHAGDLSAH